jgi:rhamnulokinase
MSAKFLAFDLGAESGRTVLGILQDDRIELHELDRFLNKPREIDGHWHWNTKEFFASMTDALSKAVKAHPDLASLSCDSWGVDFVTLGTGDRLLGEPYCYRDHRTDGIFEKTFERIPREEIYRETGLQFMAFNTLFQFLAITLGNGPSWKKVKTCLMMADYFNYLFSGKKTCELSLASTSQIYNPRKKTWSRKLLKAVGAPASVMPKIVLPGTKLGRLKAALAKQCGVTSKIQVIASCSHDTGCAVAAVPAEKGRWAYLSCGTWSLLGVELKKPLINDICCQRGFTNEVGLDGTIRFLKNIVGLWILQECRRQWEREGAAYDYAALTRLAQDASPNGAIINPDDERFNKAGDMPNKIVAFCKETGQTPPRTKGEFVRCILESLALQYRKVLEMMEGVLGYRIETLHLVGGGSRNQLLCQFTANAIGRTVVAGPVEATALGNCLIQAKALGYIKNHAHLRRVIRNSLAPQIYQPEQAQIWNDHYVRFQKLR